MKKNDEILTKNDLFLVREKLYKEIFDFRFLGVSKKTNNSSISQTKKKLANVLFKINKLKEGFYDKKKNRKRIVMGSVIFNKSDKTIAVLVVRKIKHFKYGKFINRYKKYYAHDEKNICNVGDSVRIIESKPLSKNKKWRLLN